MNIPSSLKLATLKNINWFKVTTWLLLILGLFPANLTFILIPTNPRSALAAAVPATWQKGVTLNSQSPTDFASANTDAVINQARQMGANYITLIIPLQQATFNSSTMFKAPNCPDDASLIHVITYAHSVGMKVSLKPHLDTNDGYWRAHIDPLNRDSWYSAYGNFLNQYATLAQQNQVEQIVVGTELIQTASSTSNSDNTQRWETIISQVRQRFSGSLTYSANWGGDYFSDEVDHIGFWGDLDYIGISAYYLLTSAGDNNPSMSTLLANWNAWNSTKITPLHQQYNKPVLFTEIGYRSMDGAASHPWDWEPNDPYDPQEQSDLVQALLQYWSNYSWFAGFQYWTFETNPDCCGAGDNGYSLQNKPAYTTMKNGLGPLPGLNFVVSNPVDQGAALDGDTNGTLSYALKRALAGDTITLAPSDGSKLIKVEGTLSPVSDGVQIIGSSDCRASGPVTLDGSDPAAGPDGLSLGNKNTLKGLIISGFRNKQVIFNGLGAKLSCVKILA